MENFAKFCYRNQQFQNHSGFLQQIFTCHSSFMKTVGELWHCWAQLGSTSLDRLGWAWIHMAFVLELRVKEQPLSGSCFLFCSIGQVTKSQTWLSNWTDLNWGQNFKGVKQNWKSTFKVSDWKWCKSHPFMFHWPKSYDQVQRQWGRQAYSNHNEVC